MYQKPALLRFGTMRELTQAGCLGDTDGLLFEGTTATGSTPLSDEFATCFPAGRAS
jgi:hypothetical protein